MNASSGSPATTSYVVTAEIKAAVDQRETEVLDALAIRWRDGRPHIRCPFPDHHDRRPSWRWDETAAKAHCTCSPKGLGIFDVVMRHDGCDFEAAKLRVAELLGRGDLIRRRERRRKQLQSGGRGEPAESAAGAPR